MNSFNNTVNFAIETDVGGDRILRWLPLEAFEPQQRHKDVQCNQLNVLGTGYQKLASSESGVMRKMVALNKCLFVSGKLTRVMGANLSNLRITNI